LTLDSFHQFKFVPLRKHLVNDCDLKKIGIEVPATIMVLLVASLGCLVLVLLALLMVLVHRVNSKDNFLLGRVSRLKLVAHSRRSLISQV
jgi:hypothetical protein